METWTLRKESRAPAMASMGVKTKSTLWFHLPSPSKFDLSASSQTQQVAQDKILWVILNTSHSFILLSWYQVTRKSFPSHLQNMCTEFDHFFFFFTSPGLSPVISPRLLQQPPACPLSCFLDPYGCASIGARVTSFGHKLDHVTPLSPPSKSSPSQSCR